MHVVSAVTKIGMRILLHAPQLLEHCTIALKSLGVEVAEIHSNQSASLPAGVSGAIIEANQPNAGAGFLLALAVQQKLPVLCLVAKGLPLPEPLDTVRANPAFNRQLKLARYSPTQVRRHVEQFVASCSGRGPEQPSIKFTLRLTPSLDHYLSWRASSEKAEKAQFIRRFLADRVMALDEEYKIHLQGTDG